MAVQRTLGDRTPVGVPMSVGVGVGVVHPARGVQFSDNPTNVHTRQSLVCVVIIV